MKKNLIISVLVMLGGIWLLHGCTGLSPKSRYYVFKAQASHGNDAFSLKGKKLGVGPITLPEYLNRPQIVTRQGENLLDISEFHRWGDSLTDQITGILVENLSRMLNANVVVHPWQRPFTPELQLYVDIRRFEGAPAGTVQLDTIWSLIDLKKNQKVLTRRSSIAVPVLGNDTHAYVIALNSALNNLSKDMAKNIYMKVKTTY